MANTLQERYSSLVDAKLRATLVIKDGVICNTRYEGNPKAGAVKVPVRDTEVTVSAYNKVSGLAASESATTYLTVTFDKDYAVNELIDGYDAAAVPDNIVADRLDSAGYSMALQLEKDAIAELEGNATASTTAKAGAITADNVYSTFVDIATDLTTNKVPLQNRWAVVNASVYGTLLKDTTHFIRQGDLSQKLVESGAVGSVAGLAIYVSTQLAATTNIIAGHPDWFAHIDEWAVPVHLQDLNGDGVHIGASAVQGRKIAKFKVTKAKAFIIHKTA